MASPALELRNVGISFGEKTLLRHVNLEVTPGEVFVLVGPSGQGKTVLLKILAGIMQPTEGEALVEGQNLHQLPHPEQQKLQRRMGMLFQKNALFDSLTCGENIGFPLREITHLTEDKIRERVELFLKEVAIPHARDLFPDEISGGMQKRLGIARALALEPEIIFYDDPTAGLDPITSRMIVDLILRLQAERNGTVVAITNDMNRAFQMADRIGLVTKGELIITGDVEATKKHKDPRVHQFISGELDGPLTEVR